MKINLLGVSPGVEVVRQSSCEDLIQTIANTESPEIRTLGFQYC